MTKQVDFVTDARGRGGPMPVVLAIQWIPLVPVGGMLEVLASDLDAVENLTAWTHSSGNPLVGLRLEDGTYHVTIQRGKSSEDASAAPTSRLARAA
jgi:TusA-related sulfurtransferase